MKELENKINVLLIEDNPGDTRLIKVILSEIKGISFGVENVDRLSEGLKRLEQNNVSVVLLDLGLPDSNGINTLLKLRALNLDIPIVVLTGFNNEEMALLAIKNGAQDYLVKGTIDGSTLSRAIRYALKRKQVEMELRKSENELKVILESTADGILAVDNKGKVIKTNKRFAELWRVPDNLLNSGNDNALLNFVLVQLINPEDFLNKVRLLYNSADEDTDMLFFKDGRIFERYSAPILMNNNIMGRVWSFSDFTERKHAEEALRESEERFRSLYENSTIGLYRTTPAGRIILANSTLVKMLGHSSFEELAERNLEKEGYEASYERKYFIEQIEINGTVNGLEAVWTKKDGTAIHIRESAKAVRDSNGKTLYYDGTVEDITERKRAEEALLDSEAKYRTLVTQSPDGIFIVDLSGTFLSVNKAMYDNLKYSEEELLSMKIWDIVPQEYLSIHKKRLAAIIKGENGKKATEYEVKGKDGIVHFIEVLSAPYYKDEEIIGFQGIAHDITKRKRAEESLSRNEAKLLEAMQIANLGNWEYDVDRDQFTFNDQFYALLHTSAEREGGYTMSSAQYAQKYVDPDDMHLVGVETQKAIETADPNYYSRLDHRIIYADGEKGYLAVHIRIKKDAQGRTVKTYGVNQDITNRKLVEETLHENERKLREAQEMAQLGYWSWNVKTGDVEWSEEVFRIFRLAPNSFTPHIDSILALSPWPGDHERDEELIRRAIENHEMGFYEQRFLRPDKSIGYYQSTFQGKYDDQGNLIFIIGTIQDITERKRAEDLLATERNLLRTLIDALPDRIYAKDADCRFILNNVSHLKALGANSQEDTLGKTDFDFRSREYAEKFFASDKQVFQTGKSVISLEEQSISASGESGWILSNKVPLLDSQGNIVGLVGNSSDITALKRAEQNVRMLSLAIEQSPASIVITDLEGKIEYINPKFTQLTGYTSAETLGQNPRILKSGEKPSGEYKQMWEIITSGKEWHGEFHNKKKNGELYWESASISPIKDGSGKTTHYLAVKEDITERKLLQSQLLRSQRIESIGTLAGGVAHDLNNVLAPILLSIDLLKKTTPDKRSQKMLETLETSALRGSAIVKQILGFARGVQGESVLIQIRHIINEMVNIIKETFPKSIIIKEDIPKNIWTIVGDPTNLHQVILNLCVNARDAMPNGGTIRIKAENRLIDEQYARMNIEAKLGQYVMLSIEDTGCGIPPKILERIFEPFFTTKEVGKGTGLGLSTVHSIVKSHNGFINVYSEVGKGTTFRVYLPAAKESGDVKEELTQSLNMLMGHEELILVVDDESSILQITKNTLEVYGYRTLTASDGTEAIAQFASRKDEIALVLTDMVMPVMDGVKTIQVLRKMNPAIKIIASSGLAGKDDVFVEKGLAVDAFLAKPYNAEKLLETVYSVLHKH